MFLLLCSALLLAHLPLAIFFSSCQQTNLQFRLFLGNLIRGTERVSLSSIFIQKQSGEKALMGSGGSEKSFSAFHDADGGGDHDKFLKPF